MLVKKPESALVEICGLLQGRKRLMWNIYQYATVTSDDCFSGASLRTYELHEDCVSAAKLLT